MWVHLANIEHLWCEAQHFSRTDPSLPSFPRGKTGKFKLMNKTWQVLEAGPGSGARGVLLGPGGGQVLTFLEGMWQVNSEVE